MLTCLKLLCTMLKYAVVSRRFFLALLFQNGKIKLNKTAIRCVNEWVSICIVAVILSIARIGWTAFGAIVWLWRSVIVRAGEKQMYLQKNWSSGYTYRHGISSLTSSWYREFEFNPCHPLLLFRAAFRYVTPWWYHFSLAKFLFRLSFLSSPCPTLSLSLTLSLSFQCASPKLTCMIRA